MSIDIYNGSVLNVGGTLVNYGLCIIASSPVFSTKNILKNKNKKIIFYINTMIYDLKIYNLCFYFFFFYFISSLPKKTDEPAKMMPLKN